MTGPGVGGDPLLRAVRELRPDPRRTIGAVLAGTAALGSAIGLLAASAWMISRAAQQPPVVALSVAVVAVRALGIGRGVFRYLERLVSHDVALRGVTRLRRTLYDRLAESDPAVVAGLRTGDLLARVGADVDALADVVVRGLLPFAVAGTVGLLTVGLLAAVLPAAGALTLAGLLLAGVVAPWLAARAAAAAQRAAAGTRTEITDQTQALVEGLAELTVADVVDQRLDRITDADARLAAELDRAARPAALAMALSTAATLGAVIGCLWVGTRAVQSGQLSTVMLAVVTLTPLAAVEAVAALPAAAVGLVRTRVAARRVTALLDAPRAAGAAGAVGAVGAVGAARASTAGAPEPAPVALRASGLDCAWPGRPPAVRGLDLELTPGRSIAIVGPSAIGKTTVLLTLAGLLPPVGGRVAIRQSSPNSPAPSQAPWADLADRDPGELRALISYTAEDAHIFTTTLRENLRVARPGCPDEELYPVLDRAGLGPWTAELPRGLDTMLGSGGAGLSGGERRRLLLARALLTGAPLLLLDEPAEHLDPSTADRLIADLLAAGRHPTDRHPDDRHPDARHPGVVVVTHRLAALAAADEVIVLGTGSTPDGAATVVARGHHDDLVRTHRPYAEALRAELGTVGV